ncbi:MAG: thioredoxin-disulfide reductase [Lachnospiraceae bacterium]|nr:thioredoxin-disulfide reductase [Lachnospiraceae bacterium]
MIYDVIILGSGPAGLSAAIYAKRAMLNALMIDRNYIGGGQILNTYEVDNYPGLPGISGFDLGEKMSEHADKFGIEKVSTDISSIDILSEIKTVHTDEGDFQGKAIIIATGNSPKKLLVPGEEELTGMGVSYCATCDGAFFKGKTTAVVGGGDVAIEDAIFLSRGCEKVYLIHRRDELRGAKSLQEELFNTENIEVIFDTIVTSINGSDKVESITINNVKTNAIDTIPVNGVFLAVGNDPNTIALDDAKTNLETDERGYIKASEDCKTNIPGVFAAGDIRTKKLRQVVTAVADGANAIESLQEYLRK